MVVGANFPHKPTRRKRPEIYRYIIDPESNVNIDIVRKNVGQCVWFVYFVRYFFFMKR